MSTMKSVIFVIGLISAIGTSTVTVPVSVQVKCAAISCPSGHGCIDGIGCVESCHRTLQGSTCSDSSANCVDVPDDGCILGTDYNCAGYCVKSPTITCQNILCSADSDGCVEDWDGNGTPGCVSVDDTCTNRKLCYPAPACVAGTNDCHDGSCRGCCGCTWQFVGGSLTCSWYRSCPIPPNTTYVPNPCDTMRCPYTAPICVEDIGNGSAGCIALGDKCDTCYRTLTIASLAYSKTCDDGSCRGSCGCTWQRTADGDIECMNNYVTPLQCMCTIFSISISIVLFLISHCKVLIKQTQKIKLCKYHINVNRPWRTWRSLW